MRTVSRRGRRTAVAALGALALASTLIAPAAAIAEGESELVGDAVPLLLENDWASGKVLEIGNENAQSSVNGALAPAAIFALGETAEQLQAQAVLAYPVASAENTYVFTNADGEVLARIDNADANYRYLQLEDVAVDEAATDPYAQWVISDEGSGRSSIHNAQAYENGTLANLDMYNWATADGAEIQTYDAGTAAVQLWTVHEMTPEVTAHEERVEAGTVPSLPASLTGRYSWGDTVTLTDIAWDEPDAAVWNTDGLITVTGTATGMFGESVTVTAEYLVGTVGDAIDAAMTSYVGASLKELKMAAPTTVERTISGTEQTVTANVTWDWSGLTDQSSATAGVLEVPATAATGFAARLLITIEATDVVNILRGEGINYDYLYMNGSSFGLIDGVLDAQGFDDWRSGGAENRMNPNTVSFYFDQPRQLTGAAVYDIGGRQNIGSVTVQYRDLIGGWIDMPAQGVEWPYTNTEADLSLSFDSDAVLATGMRVTFANKSTGTWMSLSEVEAYGPELAG